ncbi:MAG: SMI1/KNR4 family protein [Pirellulales bacterium]|nr:SMI1/KNR4 family protein [Pirellulales bacterium]
MPFPVDEKYIMSAEQKLRVGFPESFRRKMLQDNGGEVATPSDAWQLYPFMDTSDKKRLKRTCNDITRETASARQWNSFPKEAVAIGANGSGDQRILIPSDDPAILRDAVFWWDHETVEVTKIAEDFEEL